MKLISPPLPSGIPHPGVGWIYLGTQPFADDTPAMDGLILLHDKSWYYGSEGHMHGSDVNAHYAARIGSEAYREALRINVIHEEHEPADPDLVDELGQVISNIEGRLDWASGQFHDSTRWADEKVDGQPILSWILAPAREALERHKKTR